MAPFGSTHLLATVLREPNWIIVTLVGALLGASVGWWSSPIRYLRSRKQNSHLLGTWHECHYTYRHGQVILGRGTITVRAGFKNSLKVVADQNETHPDGVVTNLSYEGHLHRE